MGLSPQATGAKTCVTTVPLTGFSYLTKSSEGILIGGPLRTSYSSERVQPSLIEYGDHLFEYHLSELEYIIMKREMLVKKKNRWIIRKHRELTAL
ncbi:hypothetical protein TNCV_2082121 [Trichonephila clavipes]|nr:hypothetical protein TNCV_2082121 [Trichonephila clavipes]